MWGRLDHWRRSTVGLFRDKPDQASSLLVAPAQASNARQPLPGNLLLMGYEDDVPIVSAPGCFRSLKPNVVDLLPPPLLARYRVSTWEVGSDQLS